MPTYEYACKFCGHTLEAFQSMTAAPLRRCPACKRQGLKRLISGGAGLIFKGTGFYQTDYKRAVEPAKSESTKSEPAKSDKKPAETKPSSKPESAKPAPAKT